MFAMAWKEKAYSMASTTILAFVLSVGQMFLLLTDRINHCKNITQRVQIQIQVIDFII